MSVVEMTKKALKKLRDALGSRMKDYEKMFRFFLPQKLPAIIRLDGKAFHTYTKGFIKPFDEDIAEAMWETCKHLCSGKANISGLKIAYTQSDEITLLLTDYENKKTEAWFKNNVQKMVSVATSEATIAFNKFMQRRFKEKLQKIQEFKWEIGYRKDLKIPLEKRQDWVEKYEALRYNPKFQKEFLEGKLEVFEVIQKLVQRFEEKEWARFDARAFSLPKHEVLQNFIWRQKDAIKNSISMVAQANFPHKSLQGLSGEEMKEKLFREKGIIWDKLPTWQKNGACIVKETFTINEGMEQETIRNRSVVDFNTPVFEENPEYIEQYVYVGEDTE